MNSPGDEDYDARSSDAGFKAGSFLGAGFIALLGIGGLFVAQRGGDGTPYFGGLSLFVFAVLIVFIMLKRSFDIAEYGIAGGLPLFVRVIAAVTTSLLFYGPLAEQGPDQPLLFATAIGVVIFILLSVIDRVLERTR